MNNTELWRSVLGNIELSISKANFSTWFKDTTILSIENNHVSVGVPNGFAKEWLENKYQSYILQALRKEMPEIHSVSCSVYNPQDIQDESEDSDNGGDQKTNIKNNASTQKSVQTKSKQLQNKNTQQTYNPTKTQYIANNNISLNSRYTFDNFVVGEHNELAKAACHAVCKDIGKIYNPLFIYGKVGLGKTHLLQSIGNQVRSDDGNKKIVYTTSERFTTELINSIKNNTADKFKEEYQKIDLLIIDDVQFLAGKEKTQQEFFHIFNTLYNL
ncbi:MAG: DnaA/Hda family protein, partial [Patescibacteria group bacterium]|nr:DnaA/Hda family protein [Patescibacteria group bacterium]